MSVLTDSVCCVFIVYWACWHAPYTTNAAWYCCGCCVL